VDEEAGMSAVGDAVVWLNDPLNWKGPQGIPALALEQLGITAVAVGVGALVALPLAFVLGHYGRGGGFVGRDEQRVARGADVRAARGVRLDRHRVRQPRDDGGADLLRDPARARQRLHRHPRRGQEVVEAARGMGLSELQVLTRVEAPLAVPLVAAGFRTAAVQVVATAPLAALVGGGTLGAIINNGFGNQNYGQVLAGGCWSPSSRCLSRPDSCCCNGRSPRVAVEPPASPARRAGRGSRRRASVSVADS
jgi:osmoprotectant transport system permease protein